MKGASGSIFYGVGDGDIINSRGEACVWLIPLKIVALR